MFPIRDGIPSRRVPIVTIAIIAANTLVYLYQLTLPQEGLASLFYLFGVVPARLSDPAWAGSVGIPATAFGGYTTFLSSLFLHGGFLHLAFNMWTLWIFGDNVEDRLGRFRYVVFYLGCGVAAGIAQALVDPRSTAPTIGASGAIAGVLGAYLLLYPHARVLTLIPIVIYPLFVQLPALVFLGLWFLLQLWSGVSAFGQGPGAGGVAWWAHVGGFLTGMLLLKAMISPEPEQLPGPVRHFVYPELPVRGRWR
ncbi:MAG: rhomboid family intramembrane serine protease [Thermoanaerobaculia bacterium]